MRDPDRWDACEAEHEREGIGTIILEEISYALRRVLGRRPDRRIASREIDRWTSDVIEDLVYDFALFLLEGRLIGVFLHASNLQHFRSLLRTRARQFISNRVRGTELHNVVSRACEILDRDDRFGFDGDGPERRWRLKAGRAGEFDHDEDRLRTIARSLRKPGVTRSYRRATERASAVISDRDLLTMLEELLRQVSGLQRRDISFVLCERLNLKEAETVSISRKIGDEPSLEELLATPFDQFEDADARMVRDDAVQQLTLRQLRILGERYARRRTREETAQALGVSHGTVDNELRRAGEIVLEAAAGDLSLARAALEYILGMRE